MQKIHKKAITVLVALTAIALSATVAAKTFVYKHLDGTVWHTNIQPSKVDKQAYTLIGVINSPRPKKTKKKIRQERARAAVISCGGKKDKATAALAAKYEPIIDRLAKQYAISKHLVMAVVAAESCFDSRAESPKGARGLMQLMPITARELGVKDPFDHEENLRGGIQYLGKLSKRFNYNPQLTLAAYNAGPGNVEKYKGIPPFPETQAYVEKVMNQFRRYMQLASS